MKATDFLTAEEQERIVSAIRKAEKDTSGEIRIHIDNICRISPYERAVEVFNYLGMEKTRERNAVLIYVACKSKVFAIIGDKGINGAVPAHFWDDISEMMRSCFSENRYADGLAEAVARTGEKLKAFFPYRKDDINEQPDEISFEKQDSEPVH